MQLGGATADNDAGLGGGSMKVTAIVGAWDGGGGHGHPVFKALEPWETRQAEGDGGGVDSDSGGGVQARYELEKRDGADRRAQGGGEASGERRGAGMAWDGLLGYEAGPLRD